MEYRPLGKTGMEVSVLSFGASSLGGVFHPVDEKKAIETAHIALRSGINYVDVSPFYGLTKAETVLGKALKEIDRDSYYISTKVGRYGQTQADFDFSAERIYSSIGESLSRLGLEYVDMVFCHDIEFGDLDQVVEETIPALRELKEQGKLRFIGVSGYPLKIFKYVLDRTDLDVILSYCHYSLNDTTLLELVPYLKEKSVGIVNASPLSMGLLTTRGAPDWHPAASEIKKVCRETAVYFEEKGINLSRLALQFSVNNPDIPTTLVSTANPEHIRQNLQWVEEPAEMELIQEAQEELSSIRDRTWQTGRPENN